MEVKEFLTEWFLRLGSPLWILIMVFIVSITSFITGATERDFRKGFFIGIVIWLVLGFIATLFTFHSS